jgi:FMN-dependent NADH-azoreductase
MNHAALKEKGEKTMKNILFVSSSPRGGESYSHQVAQKVVDGLKSRHPEAQVVERDVAKQPLPHIGEDFVSGMAASAGAIQAKSASRFAGALTPGQAEALALSDALIDELRAADVVVIAAPMYNFGLPSTLKAWIDHVVRAQRTFSYTAGGIQGLLQGKRAILVMASGGVYSAGPAAAMDFEESYLRATLGFIGITDIRVVRVEGVSVGAIGPQNAIAAAYQQSEQVLAQVA